MTFEDVILLYIYLLTNLFFMKKKYLFSLAMAGLLLGACNSDDVVVPTGEGQGPQWDANGNGYVSLAINLPTKPAATKAFNEGSNLDDGTVEEYDVQNATLILFQGVDEATAEVVNAYSLPLKWGAGNPDQITTTAKIVQKINNISPEAGKKLYALVVLNHNGVLEVTSDAGLKVDGAVFSGTLTALNTQIAAVTAIGGWHENGFLMANAPLADKKGGNTTEKPTDVKILTLTEIDPAKIKDSYDAAEANPVANIFVERAVAKVTLTAKEGKLTESSLGETQKAYEILGWDIDNTNTKSYLVRNVGDKAWVAYKSNATSGTPGYRFLGSTLVGVTIPVGESGGASDLYRTYWGKDVNYDADASGLVTQGSDTIGFKMLKVADGETPDYCLENTTDMDRMLEKNCTRVIVKAQFNGGADFYIVNDDRSTMWNEAMVKKEVLRQFMNVSPKGIAWLEDNIKPVESPGEPNKALDTDFDVTFTSTISGVGVQSVSIALKDEVDIKNKYNEGADPSLCNDDVNNRIKIDLYKNGVAYYPVYIKHFGDDETPWNGTESGKPQVGSIYPGGAENYLGRYGVLRNNWYDISVTAIKNIGSSTVEPVTGNTIDKLESYISVKINILAWAKRSQSVVL